jgi:2-oxoglutarate ferredoxin oxidoreductase subunit delta
LALIGSGYRRSVFRRGQLWPEDGPHETGGSKLVRIDISENLCKGCDICIEFCPLEVFDNSDKLSRRGYYIPVIAKPEECNACRLCELLCPELAIIIEGKPDKKSADKAKVDSHGA